MTREELISEGWEIHDPPIEIDDLECPVGLLVLDDMDSDVSVAYLIGDINKLGGECECCKICGVIVASKRVYDPRQQKPSHE